MRIFMSLASLVAAAAVTLTAQPRLTLDYPAMARTIVAHLALAPGERVISVAHPGTFADLIPHIRYEVMKAGGIDLGVIHVLQEPVPASFEPAVLRKGAQESRASYKAMFRDVDAAIMMPGANTSHPAYLAMQDWLKDDLAKHRGRRTIHFHWVEAGSAYPIAGQPLPPRVAIDALYQRALVDTNYTAVAESQRRFAAALKTGEVHITSPSGTDLRFRTGDRSVNFQDGNASRARAASGVMLIDKEIELPSGAIRVAPVEESVDGVIAFPPSQWDGRAVEGLKLRFARGRVVEITAASGKEAVEAEMRAAGDAGRAFREFALGFNPLLAVPEREPWIPYYGYGSGVVRLSLGDNSELGGAVTGGYVRWNFFTDLTVTIGSTTWVRGGTPLMAQDPPAAPAARGPRVSPPQPQQPQSADYFVGAWTFTWIGRESPVSAGPRAGTLTYGRTGVGGVLELRAEGKVDGGTTYTETGTAEWNADNKTMTWVERLSTGVLLRSIGDWSSPIGIRAESELVKAGSQAIRVRRLYSILSPQSYNVTEEISVNGGPYQRLGSGRFQKNP